MTKLTEKKLEEMVLEAGIKTQHSQRALQAAFIEHMEDVYESNAEVSRLTGEDEMQHIAISASLALSAALEMACMKMEEKGLSVNANLLAAIVGMSFDSVLDVSFNRECDCETVYCEHRPDLSDVLNTSINDHSSKSVH